MSSGRMAKPDLEQTALQTLLVAGRTYTPAEPTYSSVREFAPHPKVGESDTPSDSSTKTPGGLKLHFVKIERLLQIFWRQMSDFPPFRTKTAKFTTDPSITRVYRRTTVA